MELYAMPVICEYSHVTKHCAWIEFIVHILMLLPCLWVAAEQGGPVFSSASYSRSRMSPLSPELCRYASNGIQERSQSDPVHSDPPQHHMYFLQAAHNPVLLWMDLEVVGLAFSFYWQHLDHCPTVQLSTHKNTQRQTMRISTCNFKQSIHAFFACIWCFIIFL
jgi:hypothetical protein